MLVKLNALLIILKSVFTHKKQHNLTKRICLKITNSGQGILLFFILCQCKLFTKIKCFFFVKSTNYNVKLP